MVCNRGTGTPVGDIRLMRLSKVAIEAADRVDGRGATADAEEARSILAP